MWTALMEKIINTGLKELTLVELFGGVTESDVMPELISSSIISLTYLTLSENYRWWKNVEAFAQLLVFVGRQTHLESFVFYRSFLTTSQTTQLLQCIA